MRFLPKRWRRTTPEDDLVLPAPLRQPRPRRSRLWPRAVAACAGAGSALVGLWWAWPPLALIVGGLALLVPALLRDDGINDVREVER